MSINVFRSSLFLMSFVFDIDLGVLLFQKSLTEGNKSKQC